MAKSESHGPELDRKCFKDKQGQHCTTAGDVNTGEDNPGEEMAAEAGDSDRYKPPDGGYGWVIVFAAFMCNMITDGTAFSFGVMLDDLLGEFGDSNYKTSWIGSLFMGVPLMAGPVASALINKYGCRAVCIAGSLLSTGGFAVSFFANSVEALCFSFGLVSGVGLAMIYTPAVVIVAFYFEKKRALATGLSVAGSGIGTLAFAPFLELLTVTYGWRGTMLILAGLMFNIAIFGALFRPLPKPPRIIIDSDSETCDTIKNETSRSSEIAKIRQLYSEPGSHSLIQLPTYMTSSGDTSDVRNLDHEMCIRKDTASTMSNYDVASLGPDYRNGTVVDHSDALKKKNSLAINGDCGVTVMTAANSNDNNGGELLSRKLTNGSHDYNQCERTNTRSDMRGSMTERSHPLYKPDIFYRGSLLWIAPSKNPARVCSCPDLYLAGSSISLHSQSQTEWCQWKHFKTVFKQMLDISIFKRPLYVIFFMSNFLLYMWYDIPYFYLPNSAYQRGLSYDEASWIISIIGIGNTIGQVAFGLIADIPYLNNSLVYGVGIFMCGACICFFPLCESMLAFSAVGSLFGTFIGANYALCSIIIVDLLSLDMLTNAYGIMMCGQGVANLIGPPLGGLMFDYSKSYVATYESSGAFIALSGLLMVAVAVHQWKQPVKTTNDDSDVLNHLSAV